MTAPTSPHLIDHMLRRRLDWVRNLVRNDNIDLYLMAVAAFVFTLLGATGVTSISVLLSMTLAVLAALSLSQIRSRRHVAEIAAAANSDPFSILLTDFPEELARRRADATELLYVGVSMRRTLPTSDRAFRKILSSGGRIRVLVADPSDDAVLDQASRRDGGTTDTESLRSIILTTLATLSALSRVQPGSLEVRVSPSLPTIGINAIDSMSRAGLVVVQHYEYRAQGEPGPILRFSPSDGYWYQYFIQEAERMWEDGVPWPPPADVSIARLPRPAFVQDFGSLLMSTIDESDDLLITGVARNVLLTSQYSRFERKLSTGARIRFLLVDPNSHAVGVAADRYYAERSPDILRSRIDHSLRLLAELLKATGGNMQVRLTTYPMAAGVVAADAAPSERRKRALLVEYFTYQAQGEPKFVLSPRDGWVFDNFWGEAEALWANATELNLENRAFPL